MLLLLFWIGTMVTGTLGLAPDEEQIRQLQADIDQGRSLDETFTLFKRIFNRSYEDDYEETMRRKIFEVNIEFIKDHNVMYAKGEHSYYLGVNEFADLTHDEFLNYYTGFIPTPSPLADNESLCLPLYNDSLPTYVDWRVKGLVTNVKNQGQCGSCWAFSTTGSLEGQHKKKSGKLISLSEQQLVDCSRSYGNDGCNGGLMNRAFEYIKKIGGIEGEVDYPYVGKDLVCRYNKSKSRATVSGYENLPSGCECSLQQAVATVGPISVAMDANHTSFQFYKGGVYNEWRCSSIKLNHAMLVVGYGTYPSDYWLVKNSWGTAWGMSGYIQMSRNKNNQCGIASYASYPLV